MDLLNFFVGFYKSSYLKMRNCVAEIALVVFLRWTLAAVLPIEL